MIKNKGFTLLELLIVIGIIGILSSVVLVSYKGHTARARLANTMQYAKSVNSLLGAYTVGAWGFDNIQGTTVYDDSANGRNGVIAGAYSVVSGVVEGNALQFNGGRVDITSANPIPGAMTFSGWFKKEGPTWGSIAFLGKRYGSGGWMLYRNSGDTAGYFRWYSFYVNTSNVVVSYRAWPGISGLSVGQWYFIAVARDALGSLKIYVDGKMVYQGAPLADFKNWSDVNYGVAIGAERAGSSGYLCTGATIDNIKIYQEFLNQTQIQQRYANGLKTHQNLAIK